MTLIDLTLPMGPVELQWAEPGQTPQSLPVLQTRTWRFDVAPAPYHARVHWLTHWGMAGTYIDFPGHIVETDDGRDAASIPAQELFRLAAAVVRLDRSRTPGPIGAEDLAAACADSAPTPALVINALGPCRFDEVPPRSVYLAHAAVDWVVARGTRLLVSDVYESDTDPQDVFRTLFRAGVATVCYPAALAALGHTPRVRLTALPLRIVGATQLPCRLLAEIAAAGVGEPSSAAPP